MQRATNNMTRSAVFFCVVSLAVIINSLQIPDSIPKFCSKTVAKFTECTLKMFQKLGPYLLEGIPPMKISRFYPVEIPLIEVESDLSSFVQVKANFTNFLLYGANQAEISYISINPADMSGNITVTIPSAHVFVEYDALGKLLHIPLVNRGYLEGNFTGIDTHFKGNLQEVDKNGTKYFALENFAVSVVVADAVTKFTAKDPNTQIAADLIQNFFNEEPRRFLGISYNLWNEVCFQYYQQVIERALSTVSVKTFFRP